MSYCRFGWDGSDVYVYESCSGGFDCCGCNLLGDYNCATPEEMIAHLIEHRKAGQFVPDYAITGLWGDVAGAKEPVHPEPESMTESKRKLREVIGKSEESELERLRGLCAEAAGHIRAWADSDGYDADSDKDSGSLLKRLGAAADSETEGRPR